MRHALFDFFIDIRHSIKARLPQIILKAKRIYEEYCNLKAEAGEEPEKLKITRQWLQVILFQVYKPLVSHQGQSTKIHFRNFGSNFLLK